MKFTYANGKRITSRLVYSEEKQLYKSKGGDKYVCYKGGCTARIIVKDNECTHVPKYDRHNHVENQEDVYTQFTIESSLKHRCQVDANTSLQEIFNEECGSSSGRTSFKKMKSTMVYNRQKSLPTNPMTLADYISYFESDEIRSVMDISDGSSLKFHKIVSFGEFAYAIFVSIAIIDNLPEVRNFSITSSMKVINNGFFKVFLSIAAVKEYEVRIIGFI